MAQGRLSKGDERHAKETNASGGFGRALEPGRRPALIVIDFVGAYLVPGSPLYACIGPVTAQTAGELSLPVGLVATQYTSEGLVQALLDSGVTQ